MEAREPTFIDVDGQNEAKVRKPVPARSLDMYDAYCIEGNVAFNRGQHAWRVIVSGIRMEDAHLNIGCIEDGGILRGRFYGVRLFPFMIDFLYGFGEDIEDARLDIIGYVNRHVIDFFLDLTAMVLKVHVFSENATREVSIRTSALSWRPYIIMSENHHRVGVTWLHPSRFAALR